MKWIRKGNNRIKNLNGPQIDGTKPADQDEEDTTDVSESFEKKAGFSIVEGISVLAVVAVLIFTVGIITAISIPAVSALNDPSIEIDDTYIETHSQEHNYVTGSVNVSKGQSVNLRAKNGQTVASITLKDLGVNERFTLEIPKVKEGETVYYVEHVNKSGDPLSDPIAVTVNCKLPKTTDMSAGTNSKLNSIVGVLCWPKGTEKKKYLYSSGSPKDAYVKAAQKYLGSEVGEIRKGRRVAFTDCSYFAATVIRMSGADPKFRALRFDYAKKNADWIVVSEGKRVDASKLIAGDVIQYKKKGGGKHVIIYLGNKLYAQASRNDQFPIIFTQNRPGKEMYNASKVNINSLQVIRNKKLASGQIQ